MFRIISWRIYSKYHCYIFDTISPKRLMNYTFLEYCHGQVQEKWGCREICDVCSCKKCINIKLQFSVTFIFHPSFSIEAEAASHIHHCGLLFLEFRGAEDISEEMLCCNIMISLSAGKQHFHATTNLISSLSQHPVSDPASDIRAYQTT